MASFASFKEPVDEVYLIALGHALYCFIRLERMAVACVQKIAEKSYNPKLTRHYVETVSAKTAIQIAGDFMAAADGMTDVGLKRVMKSAADRFRALAKRRNDLVHASPGTALNGDQRLFCNGSEWTTSDIEDLAAKFAKCTDILRDLHSKVL